MTPQPKSEALRLEHTCRLSVCIVVYTRAVPRSHPPAVVSSSQAPVQARTAVLLGRVDDRV